jgi:PAS domain S-box-containing protein
MTKAAPPPPPDQGRTELEDLRQLVAGVNDLLWALDLRTGHVRISRFFSELLGYAEGELEPTLTAWRNLCHPDDLATLDRLARENAEGLTSYSEFDYRARRKDGTWIRLMSRSSVVARDERGAPVRVVGTIADLSALKRSEERMSALLRAIPDLILRVRGDGTCLDVSSGSVRWNLGPTEQLIGRPLRELPLPGTVADALLPRLGRALREGTVDTFEYESEQPEGWRSYEARIVRSGPDEAVIIIRDVTEHRLVEQHRAHVARSEQLASLGQLAAGIAHEINSPVGYVVSNLHTLGHYLSTLTPLVEALREVMETPGARLQGTQGDPLARVRELWGHVDLESLSELPEVLGESQTGLQRIKEIIQSLRTFARDDTQPQRVDLNAELESSLRIVSFELKYKCEVTRDLAPLPPITGHPSQLAQVFINLLVNAAQAIETRGTIHIRTRPEANEVRVDISDTGNGMTAETRARLFQPFFTTKPRGQGTGMGLSISHDIISRHGGRIEVQSEPGRGTTFSIFLPVTAR